MYLKIATCLSVSLAMLSLGSAPISAQTSAGAEAEDAPVIDLHEGFENPPASARPRVWWHWMNGNVSIDGITQDLEWLSGIGIGGVQNFDAGLGTPQIVENRLVYMDDDWQAAFRHAVQTAQREGLEFAIASSPGWSQTGGPWVQPQDGMKKIVWSELTLPGGSRFVGSLPAFPTNAGPFQTVALRNRRGDVLPAHDQPELASGFIAAIAVPVTAPVLPTPIVMQEGGNVLDALPLEDASYETSVTVDVGDADDPGAIILRYDSPVTVRSAHMFAQSIKRKWREAMFAPELQAWGHEGWESVAAIALNTVPTTTSFAPVTASRFRLVFHPVPNANAMNLGDGVPGADDTFRSPAPLPETIELGDLRLSAERRIDRVEEKANFAVGEEFYAIWDSSDEAGLALGDTIDLADHLQPDGSLDWTPPAGRDWRVIHLGWSLTGEENHPASPEATGLEVDKFDATAVRRYVETYLGMYRQAVGPDLIGDAGLTAILTDSIEVGGSNWTGDMLEQFEARRGYDMRPWLPALMGHVMISPDASERFLYDFRLTLTELLTDSHYATVAQVAREHGLTIYGEALEGGRAALGDDLAMRSHTDIPMAAMWMFNPDEAPRAHLIGDIMGAASVAHIYGQNIVAAESLTTILAPWGHAPSDLKRVMDLEFVLGVNRPVIHTSVHQPSDDHVPGLSLGSVGQYFNRHETWADMADAWVSYMARSSFLLQQGRGLSDIAYFYGEETPIVEQFADGLPADLPTVFGVDFVNAQILTERMQVEDGMLTVRAPGTARYRALYLGGTSEMMTLATLEHIAALAEAGALVIGERPLGTPNLQDDPAAFAALADRLWAGGDVTVIGQGMIMRGGDPEQALLDSGVAADFTYTRSHADSEILFLHRRLDDGDIYFLTNRLGRREATEARFRVTGRLPELWDAVTGTSRPLSFRVEGDHTVVPLDLAADEAVFIVFREPTAQSQRTVDMPVADVVVVLDNAWHVTFQPDRGAPPSAAMPVLAPLNTHDDAGIRYFSGVATYTSEFAMPRDHSVGTGLWLDLGAMGDVAQVRINGVEAGTTWFAPHRLDIANLVQAGTNIIEVRVANLWRNRLIGDAQPGADPVAFVTSPTYRPDAQLRPSGLIGPVRILSEAASQQ